MRERVQRAGPSATCGDMMSADRIFAPPCQLRISQLNLKARVPLVGSFLVQPV